MPDRVASRGPTKHMAERASAAVLASAAFHAEPAAGAFAHLAGLFGLPPREPGGLALTCTCKGVCLGCLAAASCSPWTRGRSRAADACCFPLRRQHCTSLYISCIGPTITLALYYIYADGERLWCLLNSFDRRHDSVWLKYCKHAKRTAMMPGSTSGMLGSAKQAQQMPVVLGSRASRRHRSRRWLAHHSARGNTCKDPDGQLSRSQSITLSFPHCATQERLMLQAAACIRFKHADTCPKRQCHFVQLMYWTQGCNADILAMASSRVQSVQYVAFVRQPSPGCMPKADL